MDGGGAVLCLAWTGEDEGAQCTVQFFTNKPNKKRPGLRSKII